MISLLKSGARCAAAGTAIAASAMPRCSQDRRAHVPSERNIYDASRIQVRIRHLITSPVNRQVSSCLLRAVTYLLVLLFEI